VRSTGLRAGAVGDRPASQHPAPAGRFRTAHQPAPAEDSTRGVIPPLRRTPGAVLAPQPPRCSSHRVRPPAGADASRPGVGWVRFHAFVDPQSHPSANQRPAVEPRLWVHPLDYRLQAEAASPDMPRIGSLEQDASRRASHRRSVG